MPDIHPGRDRFGLRAVTLLFRINRRYLHERLVTTLSAIPGGLVRREVAQEIMDVIEGMICIRGI
jgi:hypothetical protein